jgi:hypothetical protein
VSIVVGDTAHLSQHRKDGIVLGWCAYRHPYPFVQRREWAGNGDMSLLERFSQGRHGTGPEEDEIGEAVGPLPAGPVDLAVEPRALTRDRIMGEPDMALVRERSARGDERQARQ